jgi:hypothetical protein
MQRTQIYLTDEQQRAIAGRARDGQVSKAEVIRRILDRELGLNDGSEDRLASVDATAGVLPNAPDWPEWLAHVRGGDAAARLDRLGL